MCFIYFKKTIQAQPTWCNQLFAFRHSAPLPWCRKGGGAEMTDSVQEECPRIAVQTAATIQEEGPRIAAQTAATSPSPSPYL